MRAIIQLLQTFALVAAQSLPTFILPCKLDWKLNICAIANGNKAIPQLAKGDSLMPPVDPLQLVSISVIDSNSPTLRVNMTFRELYAYGLKDAVITRSDIDLRAKHMVWSLKVPEILFGFKYRINGLVSSRPVTGTGNGVMAFDDVELIYLLDFNLVNITENEYIEVVHTEVRHTVQRLTIQLNDLFNGNKARGHEMNILLNEHWRDLNRLLGPPIDKAFVFSLKPIVDYLLTIVPVNNLFPK
ncbi:Hypothetical protein NTJ_02944 [Nesidiocoris tenuis]|uniref:Protein takeout n=1 Tax=Nesidiocoris tenuis TaxID=355587 RepID=A0ABN7AFW1_9HEMI|nr:Hypothetical protein NTJ_02944 [Nesidiocoris tenuis]